ncbi:hypothetical protein Hanom_Chr06g00511491 [Helianthus anomalus]
MWRGKLVFSTTFSIMVYNKNGTPNVLWCLLLLDGCFHLLYDVFRRSRIRGNLFSFCLAPSISIRRASLKLRSVWWIL